MIKYFFTLGLSFSVTLLANVEQICLHAKASILGVEENRLYIDPSRLLFENGALVLISDENEHILLPHIFQSEKGLYLNLLKSDPEGIWVCFTCGGESTYLPYSCKYCKKDLFSERF